MQHSQSRVLAAAFVILLMVMVPAMVCAQDSDEASQQFTAAETQLDAATVRFLLLHPPENATEAPGLLLILNEHPVRDTLQHGVSPIDTLHKSPVEMVFWGKNGFYRLTGIFHTDPDNPTNDLRNLARWRRTMLSLHQTLGLITVASMTATVVGGQFAIDGRGSTVHKVSLPFTIGLYATTATLAITSPPKLVPSHGVDTVTFHKWFAAAHLAGMVITPMLAPDFEDGEGNGGGTHQILGYATYAAFTAGMIIVTYFR